MSDLTPAALAAARIFRKQIIADIRRDIAAHEAALARLSGTLLGAGHIVVSAHGLAITFDREPAEGAVALSNPRVTSPGAALRFTMADALRIAAATRDGTGEPFKAVHVTHALREAIKRDEAVLAQLQAADDEDKAGTAAIAPV